MARILVVDDNPAIRQVMTCCLPGFGHAVNVATNGAEALAAWRSDPPELMLVDVEMPVMDGLALCRALKADPAAMHLPVVMMTGRPSIDLRRRAAEAGAAGLLAKPFTWSALEDEIGRHLPAGV